MHLLNSSTSAGHALLLCWLHSCTASLACSCLTPLPCPPRAQKKSEKKEYYFLVVVLLRIAFWFYCYGYLLWVCAWRAVKAGRAPQRTQSTR
jgi:hypothetical protein